MTKIPVYYLISDLHIGGEEALGVCDFEDELIGYLLELSGHTEEDVELIIVGDAFGLWEITTVQGSEKLDAIVAQFPRIFETFRQVGRDIKITLLAGNHDYELACYPEFGERLKAYNIHLEQTPSIIRRIGHQRLWIEHGSQHDPANRVPDYGNPYAQPIGYFITRDVVGVAAQRSRLGRYNWLKDIQSVYPTEAIPTWILSNYFYREMSPILRWIALPFLMFFSFSVFVVIGAGMEFAGVSDTNIFLNNQLFRSLGLLGSLLQLVLTANAVILAVLIVLAFPGWFILRDVRQTARRFGLVLDPTKLTGQKEDAYLDAARAVFQENPDVAAFIYGHTHAPSVRKIGDRAVINTGTWIKQFQPVKVRFGILPRIYVPRYCLSSFRISAQGKQIVVAYREVKKAPGRELTWLQRMLMSRRVSSLMEPVPEHTILEAHCDVFEDTRSRR
ncbi:calcineurin-like phosphoesterase family protein [Dichotomicrobium thermohalophilum]|uniref:Calcineurin-like phosphoesterase family protein n=2 Tax=Dichotomicrobium thermohalophilum TaxID=933063 RepID=A0A397PNS4_9HYPH|nr:calcineurin-like phosphoesterase family protein [Dichotomicrobium thermohalophilum]